MKERTRLNALTDKVEIKTRVKSTSSFMKKELSLSDVSKGGRKKEEIYDILGVRVIIFPRFYRIPIPIALFHSFQKRD